MSICLIDKEQDKIILPQRAFQPRSGNGLNRRDFLLYASLSPAIALLPVKEANALWPILIGIVARSVIQGIARIVGRSVATRVAGRAAVPGSSYVSLSSRVQASVVEEIVSDLAEAGITNASRKVVDQLARETPQALWSKNEKKNPLVFRIENRTDRKIESSFSLVLRDIDTNNIDVEKSKFVTIAEPFKKASFKIESFSDLPSVGNKEILGIVPSNEKGLKIGSTGKIIVMKPQDIYIGT